jgi:hypothetical protein
MDYQPNDFQIENMNSLKYLWIFKRRLDLVKDALQDLSEEEKQKKIPEAFFYAGEKVQFETGLSEAELLSAMYIGAMIAEFDFLMNLESDEEREEFIEFMNDPSSLYSPANDVISEWKSALRNINQDSRKNKEEFNNIINNNFEVNGDN